MTTRRNRVRLTADEMRDAIVEIIARGNDVEVRRGRNGTYIVIEVVRLKYRAGDQ